MKYLLFVFLLTLILIGIIFSKYYKSNSSLGKTKNSEVIRYIALGDSYTIGEGVNPEEAWPNILTQHLKKDGINIELVANPSRTGWTTKQVINYELPIFESSKPSFATLLIGVNDRVQGVDKETFRNNLSFIIDKVQQILPKKDNVVLVTIPDFSVTPAGERFSNGRDVSAGLKEFNDIIKVEAEKRKLEVVDIFPVSKEMKNNPELVAKDKLHPSAKEYAIWETLIYPTVYQKLKG